MVIRVKVLDASNRFWVLRRFCNTVACVKCSYSFKKTSFFRESKIWDLRGSKKHEHECVSDLSILKTNKGLTSAFFSPDGNKVVQTCNDDCLRIYDSSDIADPKREWLLLNFAADCLCTVYSSRTEFVTSPKSAATIIFCPQRIHKNYFPLRETYQNGTFEGMGIGFGNCSYV